MLFFSMLYSCETLGAEANFPADQPLIFRGTLIRIFAICHSNLSSENPREISLTLIQPLSRFDQHNESLTQRQIEAILQLCENNMPESLVPTRPGDDFSEIEKGIGIAITQLAPKSEGSYLEALGLVFSEERAKKILEHIVLGENL